MRVLIADLLAGSARARLTDAGLGVDFHPDLEGEALTRALERARPEVLVVRSTQVERPHLEATDALGLVVRAGAGVNTIDTGAAAQLGVYVCNCPGTNAAAVAELTLGHILNADRRIADNVADLRAGHWRKRHYGVSHGLKGRTLGIIGLGAIGRAVARRALAFEMTVVAFDPQLTDETAASVGVARLPSPIEVAAVADILTVHVALLPATRGLIDAKVLGALRPGAIFVNTSRGAVVDEVALTECVRERGLVAGLDVFRDEPASDGPWDAPLAAVDGVYGTHHIAASTSQAQRAVADETCRIIIEYQRTGHPPNAVNQPRSGQSS